MFQHLTTVDARDPVSGDFTITSDDCSPFNFSLGNYEVTKRVFVVQFDIFHSRDMLWQDMKERYSFLLNKVSI